MAETRIITFKADAALCDALDGIPNRSEFIRTAVLAALQDTCPLCCGTGILTVRQREHWDEFARSHSMRRCSDCSELHLVCGSETDDAAKP